MARNRSRWFGRSTLLTALLLAGGTPLAADQEGWLIGFKFGRSSLQQTFDDREGYSSFDDRADGAALEVGYFFNQYLGVQAGYQDLGTFRGTGSSCPLDPPACREVLALFAPVDAEAEVTGWSLAAVPTWPFSQRLAAYGKVGVFDRRTELSSGGRRNLGGRDVDRLSGTDLLTGVGLRYRFGKSLGALVEYQRVDLDTVALGISWAF